MLTYWIMFLLPAWASLAGPSKPLLPSKHLKASWLLTGVLLSLLVGLRHEVGGDWMNYQDEYQRLIGANLEEIMERGDPGYNLLLWLSSQWGAGIYLINAVFGTLFSIGLVAFCRQQPRPWLALTVAVPYLVTVVGMGYSRQGVALGLVMLGMVFLVKKKSLQFVLCVALGATFHKSAVVLIPLSVLATPRGRLWNIVWVGITAATLYSTLLGKEVDKLVTNYIEAQYQSDGAAVRIAMNALPAAILLLFRKRLVWSDAERNLWLMMAALSLAAAVWLALGASSTAVDRLALYLIPLQLFVFSRLPELIGSKKNRRAWIVMVVAYYAAVYFVWLNFAVHSFAWIPYRSWLFL